MFQNFVLVAMQSRQDVNYRRLVWGEKNAALELLRLKEDQVSCISRRRYLHVVS
jgi:hypothetical protein